MATISDQLATDISNTFKKAQQDLTNQDLLLFGTDDVTITKPDGVTKVKVASWNKLMNIYNAPIKRITATDDWDDITSGTYSLSSASAAAHRPPATLSGTAPNQTLYGILVVDGHTTDATSLGFLVQTFTDKFDGSVYRRTRNDGANAWTGWVKGLDSTGTISIDGDVVIRNNKSYRGYKADGTTIISLLSLTSNDHVTLGNSSLVTTIAGSTTQILGDATVNGALTSSGGKPIRADHTATAARNQVGGSIQSRILTAGAERGAFGLYVQTDNTASENRTGHLALTVDGSSTATKNWEFDMAGQFTSPGNIRIHNGPHNHLRLDAIDGDGNPGQIVNDLSMDWYSNNVVQGIVRGGSTDLNYYILRINAQGGIKDWAFYWDGGLAGPGGAIQGGGSDRILKDNIEDAKGNSLDRINKIRRREFNWKNNGRFDRGYIAQELEEIDPTYVYLSPEMGDNHRILNVSQNALISDLIGSVQELTKRVKELEAEKENK